MSIAGKARATLDDLGRTSSKAELIGGRIVPLMPTGYKPGRVALMIVMNLHQYATQVGRGVALGDNVGFAIPQLPSGRESFSPDAAYFTGALPADPMRFLEGAPVLAVEVRSENDYGPAAEREMASKRADYFAAGTDVVWDVDPIAECVHVYRSTQPQSPATYRRGDVAEAEPAAPGWRVAVDGLFS